MNNIIKTDLDFKCQVDYGKYDMFFDTLKPKKGLWGEKRVAVLVFEDEQSKMLEETQDKTYTAYFIIDYFYKSNDTKDMAMKGEQFFLANYHNFYKGAKVKKMIGLQNDTLKFICIVFMNKYMGNISCDGPAFLSPVRESTVTLSGDYGIPKVPHVSLFFEKGIFSENEYNLMREIKKHVHKNEPFSSKTKKRVFGISNQKYYDMFLDGTLMHLSFEDDNMRDPIDVARDIETVKMKNIFRSKGR